MSDATIFNTPVDQARGWAESLIRSSHRGPGDTVDAAIHRASVKHGIDAGALRSLRYRTPKDMLVSVYLKIKAAYEVECERQEAKLRHELAITKALPPTEARLALISETEALLGALEIQTGGSPAQPTT